MVRVTEDPHPDIEDDRSDDGAGSPESDPESGVDDISEQNTIAHDAALNSYATGSKKGFVCTEITGQKGTGGTNILHKIVYPSSSSSLASFSKLPFKQVVPLINAVVSKYPDLLSQPDDQGATALNLAITKKKWEYLDHFLECRKGINLAPTKRNPNQRDYLVQICEVYMKKLKHASRRPKETDPHIPTVPAAKTELVNNFFWNCITKLTSQPMIETETEIVNKRRKKNSNETKTRGEQTTPLHVAVEYYIDSPPTHQKKLIDKLLSARPELLKSVDGSDRSPYRHRLHTRTLALEREKKRIERKIKKVPETKTVHVRGNTTTHKGTVTNKVASSDKPVPATGAGSDSTDQIELVVEHKRERESADDEITFLLKNLYMNLPDRDEAALYLYGTKGKKFAMEFDLSEHSHTGYRLPPESARKVLRKHLKFENILRYVDLPRVIFDETGKDTPSAQKPEDTAGRTDLEVIFKWLRKECKVEKIIRVKVEDSKQLPHSDESIENCLSDFDVQVWDWNKTDLCCSTIIKAAPDVQEVYLYCSGNNAVLRSWASADGLAKLEKLNKVYVLVEQGLESEDRARAQLEAFKSQLISNAPHLKMGIDATIKKSEKKKKEASKAAQQVTTQQGEMWVQHMNDFVNFVANLKGLLNSKPVKVALIDDGVDGAHVRFGRNIKAGISFCRSSDENKHVYDYWLPSGCHGTQMASLIHQLCPEVELYVARLQDEEAKSDRQIDPASAVMAIDWAVEQEVDIISMSWTFQKNPKNESALDDLEKAVKRAAAKDILMFCSTGDKGRYKDGQIYPACLSDVFRIGAAKALGKERDETEMDSQFLLPGENLQAEKPSYIDASSNSLVSGSSLATALASGLAALLLHCIDDDHLRARAGKYTQMRTALERMSAETKAPRYLKVWEYLDPAFKNIYSESPSKGKAKLDDVMKRLFP